MQPPPIPPAIDAPKRMSMKYTVTRGDIFHWHIYVLLRNRVLLVLIMATNLFMVWRDLQTPEFAGHSVGFKVFYGVFYSVVMFAFIGIGMVILMMILVMSKKFRGLLGEHELEIRDEGLWERTDVNESLSRWEGFHKIVRKGKHLYIFVTDNNAHIVPRRCFASEQEEQAFCDELERHMANHRRVAK